MWIDVWQLPLKDTSGAYMGNVVAQIIEPDEYMVRYFLIYNPDQERRFLVPTDSVTNIETEVLCDLSQDQASLLPEYDQSLERDEEIAIYQILDRTPYWELSQL